MYIHHLRNATLVIETKKYKILIDPMIGKKGSMPPFAFFRHEARKNPTVELPENSREVLKGITHCFITHCQKGHFDHLDKDGIQFLRKNNIPIICSVKDKKYLIDKGLNILNALEDWELFNFPKNEITVSAIPALHGKGWITKFMANGVGYFISIEGEPNIYISGDTVLTKDVKKAIKTFQPDITVVASGIARLDFGKPILMQVDEILEFIKLSPIKVISNHLEALNHCPLKRIELKQELTHFDLLDKVWIPMDGESMEFHKKSS